MESEFSVKWKNHSHALSSVFKSFLDDHFLVDCTVAAEGQCLKAHRLLLSACSPYFQLMFKQDNEKHPIIFLKDTKFVELKALINFIYQGEAQIPEDCLETFFHLAQSLQIEGLNDTAKSHVSEISVESTSINADPTLSLDCVTKDSSVDSQNSLSNYFNNGCEEEETGVVQPNNSSEYSLVRQSSYSSNVHTNFVKPIPTTPSEECNDSSYGQVNSSLVTPQQSSCSPIKMPPDVKESIKSEQEEIEIFEPKFEDIDSEVDTEVGDDFPQNDTVQEEITSGNQTENMINQIQDWQCLSGDPPFVGVDPAISWHQQFPSVGSAASVSFENLGCPSPSETPRPNVRQRSRTQAKPFKCETCNVHFTKKSPLMRHLRRHNGERPYKCDVCQAAFSCSSHLSRHKRTHTGEKPYKCIACHASFSDSSALSHHKRTHTGEKPHKCDVCQTAFSRSSHLSTHKRIHTGEKPYKCNACHASFSDFSALSQHKRTHTGEKPHKCDVCQTAFSRSSHLSTHMRTHTGEKSYKCNVCQVSFSDSSALSKHKRTHTGEKPYKCDLCQAAFYYPSYLTRHKLTHTGEKPYICDVCPAAFSQASNLSTHKRTHTSEKLYT